MTDESCITDYSRRIVEHLLSLSSYMEMDKNYDTILKYTALSLKRVDCNKTKLKDKNGIYSLSDWVIELVRLTLSLGRAVNKMRKKQGMLALNFFDEATKKELTDATDRTKLSQDTSTGKG